MSSQKSTVDYIVSQMAGAGMITYRKMFGDYAFYCNGKVIGLICDDQLFIKPTKAGKEFIDELFEAPPYPGAKDYYQIPEDKWDDSEWLSELVKISYEELPMQKKKNKK